MSSEPRNLKAEQPGDRLQKVLAQAGIASRREIDRMLKAGRVLVNGQTALPGVRLVGGEEVLIDGQPVELQDQAIGAKEAVIAYHKPAGEVTALRDPEGRKTVFSSLPEPPSGRWISVGRLDFNTSGLLLFATDGELTHRLMHPRNQLEREYAVRIRGSLSDGQLEALLGGVELEDGVARFLSLIELHPGSSNCWYQVVLREGRNREVRRLFEAVGLTVSRLIRTRYGPVELGRMRRGEVRELTAQDKAALYRAADLAVPV